MKMTRDHNGITIEFEDTDSFELKKLMQLHMESIFQLAVMISKETK